MTAYLVRHGAMRRVGRFAADGGPYRRGEVVVVRSRRGEELGEVLAESAADDDPPSARLLRLAEAADHDRARSAARDRVRRLASCDEVFRDGAWPLELIDAEPMLDGLRTVLLYLGPHRLDDSGLVEALRARCGLDAVLEPIGLDAPDEDEVEVEEDDHGCGSCGSGGGCGSSCGPEAGGCSGCAVKDLVRGARASALAR